jgi:hypothetical protein
MMKQSIPGDESGDAEWKRQLTRSRSVGYDALVNALGPEDAVRFIRSFDPGSGASTKERKKSFKKKSVKQIGKEILELQKSL